MTTTKKKEKKKEVLARVEKCEHLDAIGGNIKWCTCYGN